MNKNANPMTDFAQYKVKYFSTDTYIPLRTMENTRHKVALTYQIGTSCK